ncbi:MAG: ABC transporter permease [Melioribacteraceae bacterium]|nr:ABC transporter permease [Melioribacteraceae bacterium]
MSLPLFIARKYISSKQGSKFLSFVSVISITGIAIGTAVLIIALTILDGYEKVVSEKIVDFNSHIKITAFGNRNLPDSETMENEIVKITGEDFDSISKFVAKLGIIKSKTLSEGITIFGIDPESDNSDIEKFLVEGSFTLRNDNNSKIIHRKKVSRKIRCKN